MPSIGRFRYLEAPAGLRPATAGQVPGDVRPRGVLVLIHAFPLDARMWEPQLALADRGWRVIAPHLRQFDAPNQDPPARTIDDFAGDVIDLLDALQIPQAVIGGLSIGGYIALAIFRHAPRYVRALVLADSRAEADTPEGVAGRKRMLALVRDRGPSAVIDELLPRLLGRTTGTSRPDVLARVRSLASAASADAIAGAVAALMTRPDSSGMLSTIHCPTLVMVGDEDVITPPALSDAIHAAIRGSELIRILEAGHLANLERPEAFNHALAQFLDHRV